MVDPDGHAGRRRRVEVGRRRTTRDAGHRRGAGRSGDGVSRREPASAAARSWPPPPASPPARSRAGARRRRAGRGAADGATRARRTATGAAGHATAGPLRAGGLTVNGAVDPVGRRPRRLLVRLDAACDRARRRRRRPTGSWCGGPTPATPAPVWDSGTVRVGPAGLRPLRRAGARRPTPPTSGPCRPRRRREAVGTGVGSGAASRRRCGAGDWHGAVAASRPARSAQPDRVTYLRTEVHPAVGHDPARHRLRLRRAHLPPLRRTATPVDAWPSFSYPDEQYARAVDLTGVVRRGPANAIGVLHRWYGRRPGAAGVRAGPALPAVALVRRRAPRRRTGSDGDVARAARPNGCPRRCATPTSATSSSGSTGGPTRRDGRAPATTTAPGRPRHGHRPGGQRALHPDVRAAHDDPRRRPSLPVSLHTLRRRRRGGRLRRRVRGPAPGGVRQRASRGRTVAMRVGYLLDPDGQVSTLHGTPADEPLVLLHHGRGPQAFEAFTYFGFRYLQIDDPGAAPRPGQVVALARHAAMPAVPDGHVLIGQPHAQRRLAAQRRARACTAARSSSSTRRPGRRVSSSGTPPTSPRRSCAPTATRTSAGRACGTCARGQARYWPDGRVERGVPQRRRGARVRRRSPPATPSGCGATTSRPGDRATRCPALHVGHQGGRRGCGRPGRPRDRACSTAWPTPATATPSTATTSPWRRTRRATCSRSTPSTAWPSWPPSPATPAARRLWQSRAAQLTAAINAALRRRGDGVYVDGVDADGRAERPRLAGGQRTRPGLRRRAAGRTRRPWAPTWPASASTLGPNHGLELLRGLGRGGPARRDGAHAHRRVRSRAGPTSWPPAAPSPGRSGRRAT